MNTYYFNIKIYVAALACLLLASCSDWLTVTPRDMISEDNFWNEKADLEQYVTGIYVAMQQDDFIKRCIMWGEGRSDNLYPAGHLTSGDYYEVMRENLLSTNVYANWAQFYHVINQCNVVLKMAPMVSEKDPSFRASDVKAIQAEVTALRSLCYFYLIRAFDEVPFTRTAVMSDAEVEYLPAKSFKEVLNEIISDLEAVKADAVVYYASGSRDGVGKQYWSNVNRITKTAINAMLADMYLWKGDYDKSIAYAEEVIEQKRVDYTDNFSKKIGANDNDPQLVQGLFGFEIPMYVASNANPNAISNALFGTENSYESIFELGFNNDGSNGYVESRAIGEMFGSGSTSCYNKGTGYLIVNPMIVSDVSTGSYKYFTHSYDVRYYTSFEALDADYNEGYMRKGVAKKFNLFATGSTQLAYYNLGGVFELSAYLDRNWIFYRLSDMLFIEAEAYAMKAYERQQAGAELSEYSEWLKRAFDLVYVNNKRSTTLANNYLRTSDPALTNASQALTLILGEREREFIFEGKRWFDLLRQARRDGNTSIVKAWVMGKISGNTGDLFPSMDALYWPYFKEELKVNPYLKQKAIYANEASDEFEMN